MGFLSGWRFPALVLPMLATAVVLMVVVLLLPPTEGGFAEAFRAWCFKADPVTGHVNGMAVFTAFTEPVLLAAVVWWLWGGSLSQAVHERAAGIARWAAGGVLLAIAAAVPIVAFEGPAFEGPPPVRLPELRTALPAPPLRLVDQDGRSVDIAALRGRVVVVTAVYSTCGLTCPTILAQVRKATAGVPEVTVLAITLDPERDTPERLAKVRREPGIRFLSGPPADVHKTLDDYGYRRERDPKTGVIQHVNLFHVIDREGRIAFRFSIGAEQEALLAESLRLLVAEQ